MRHFSDTELRRLRNDVSVRWVIEALLQLPSKEVEGVYRFLCPLCHEFETGLNPRANLARCFCCEKNFNPIELVLAERRINFVASVTLLQKQERFLTQARNGQPYVSRPPEVSNPVETTSLQTLLINIACGKD